MEFIQDLFSTFSVSTVLVTLIITFLILVLHKTLVHKKNTCASKIKSELDTIHQKIADTDLKIQEYQEEFRVLHQKITELNPNFTVEYPKTHKTK